MPFRIFLFSLSCLLLAACSDSQAPVAAAPEAAANFDILIRNGMVYTGDGGEAVLADVAISGDRIAAVGQINGTAKMVIDAGGLAVAPGFINMLSWATESLLEDGRSQSDIRQGVTLEVMGEGWSMGPLNDAMKAEMLRRQGDIKYEIEWTTLGDYLAYLEKSGISNNVASFIGATTVRIHELGEEDRPPTAEELER
ncbi:MAG: D-aminoacylase, partial [Xanthomonadales bacterium]|nr:D-aminoacylase [Xanthomonadales bacterium]MDH4001224.1 D-aminoacylase [Xanthomonadales bacterium]